MCSLAISAMPFGHLVLITYARSTKTTKETRMAFRLRCPAVAAVIFLAAGGIAVPTAVARASDGDLAAGYAASSVPSTRQWQRDVAEVLSAAWDDLGHDLPDGDLAIVLDIDNTSIGSYWDNDSHPLPAEATLDLARWADRNSISIMFVTNRRESGRDYAISQLRNVGYPVDGMYMKTTDSGTPASRKTAARRAITADGYRIVANIGNNEHDLVGGYADHAYLLPNYDGELD